MFPLLMEQTKLALHAEAVMEVLNENAVSAKGSAIYGPSTVRTIQNGLLVDLVISLAKLFDPQAPRASRGETVARRHNGSDVASLAVMVRLLKQRRCSSALAARAGFPAMEVHEALSKATRRWATFRRSSKSRHAVTTLKEYRDKLTAHLLLVPPKTKPRYNELFHLMDAAMEMMQPIAIAVTGTNHALGEYEAMLREDALDFWSRAFPAIMIAADEGGVEQPLSSVRAEAS